MSPELFVYWQVDAKNADAAIAAAHALQTELRARFPQLTARLYRRPGERAGRVTVMEVYAATGDLAPDVSAAIATAAQRALSPWVQGPRNVETFEPLLPSPLPASAGPGR